MDTEKEVLEMEKFLKEDGKDTKKEKEAEAEDRGTYFEDALILCGYGKFHYFLFLTAALSQIANVIVTGDSSYLIANAECDLNMTMADKGALNAAPFLGMIVSGLITGFLSDALGRKVFLVWGYAAMCFCVWVQAASQSFSILLVMKFFEGFAFTGPFTVVITYVGELHCNKMRSKIMLYIFCFVGVSNAILPMVAWMLLPQNWNLTLADGNFVLKSWNIFLLVNSLWAMLTSIAYSFLPESPKFLLTNSRHDEALAILSRIYSLNTGKPADTYPVDKVYLNMTNEKSEGLMQSLKSGFSNVKPLFTTPYITKFLHISTMQFGVMFGFNIFRLWYPQLSTIFENYSNNHNETGSLCTMIDDYLEQKRRIINVTVTASAIECVRSGSETYINSAILGLVSILPYLMAGFLINKLGKRALFIITNGICGILSGTLHLSVNSVMIMAYFSIFVPMAQTGVNLLLTVTVDSFPTSFRALALSALMVIGRIGSVIGNMLFPYLLEMGCLVPFIMIASVCFLVAFLGIFIKNK